MKSQLDGSKGREWEGGSFPSSSDLFGASIGYLLNRLYELSSTTEKLRNVEQVAPAVAGFWFNVFLLLFIGLLYDLLWFFEFQGRDLTELVESLSFDTWNVAIHIDCYEFETGKLCSLDEVIKFLLKVILFDLKLGMTLNGIEFLQIFRVCDFFCFFLELLDHSNKTIVLTFLLITYSLRLMLILPDSWCTFHSLLMFLIHRTDGPQSPLKGKVFILISLADSLHSYLSWSFWHLLTDGQMWPKWLFIVLSSC